MGDPSTEAGGFEPPVGCPRPVFDTGMDPVPADGRLPAHPTESCRQGALRLVGDVRRWGE
jgi:hypothetical protein